MTGKFSRPSMANIVGISMLFLLALTTSGCQETNSNTLPAETGAGVEAENRPTLRWEAPATREDGSHLSASDIKEYRVYYRLRHQDRFKTISRPVSEGTAFALKQFKPGAYEFSVSTIDSEGLESRRSDGVNVNLI
jgi:hypothetical protein